LFLKYTIYDNETNEKDDCENKYEFKIKSHSQINWASLGALSSVWLYAVIDAYIDVRKKIKDFKKEK